MTGSRHTRRSEACLYRGRGRRPSNYTPDHLPIIDEPVEGFYVLAAGGHGMMWGPALGEKMAGLISEGRVENLPQEDIELARFSRERDPNRVEDAIALPFPKA